MGAWTLRQASPLNTVSMFQTMHYVSQPTRSYWRKVIVALANAGDVLYFTLWNGRRQGMAEFRAAAVLHWSVER